MKRYLELEYKEVKGWGVLARIVKQTHREKEFTPGGDTFHAKDKFELSSISNPAMSATVDRLYVRGATRSKDRRVLLLTPAFTKRVKEAVAEYNNKYGGTSAIG